jgi:hypothetical protein
MVSLRLKPVSGNPIDITRDPSLVGRDPTCEVVVADGSVSRRHARLEMRSGEWWVVDQGSANGTYVNSLKIAETTLKNGQELRFGALAFRVDVQEDAEATVSAAILPEETMLATPTPEPAAAPPPPPPPPAPAPSAPPPPPPASGASAGHSRSRPGGSSPVPQMAGGAPPAKKGKGPVFWIAVGCCGCLLPVLLLGGLLGGGFLMTWKGTGDASHAWLDDVRQGRTEEAMAGLTDEYRSRLTPDEVEELTSVIRQSTDATFPSRSANNDRAVLTGVLTGSGQPHDVIIKLVKEGDDWKVDDVSIDDAPSFGQ